jgi:hypothetical protein
MPARHSCDLILIRTHIGSARGAAFASEVERDHCCDYRPKLTWNLTSEYLKPYNRTEQTDGQNSTDNARRTDRVEPGSSGFLTIYKAREELFSLLLLITR